MRVHTHESERPPSVDLLTKFLRRGSIATDPSTESSSSGAHKALIAPLGDLHIAMDMGMGNNVQRKRKSPRHHAQSNDNNNNQRRLSITGGNSRFSALFIDPLYHAIMTGGKNRDDGGRESFSGAAAAAGLFGMDGAAHVFAPSDDETTRREVLFALSFSDLHAAFDPFHGAAPPALTDNNNNNNSINNNDDDAIDNNELETLLEQKGSGGRRETTLLELKEPVAMHLAAHAAAHAHHSNRSSSDDDDEEDERDLESTFIDASECSLAAALHSANEDDDDDDELRFDEKNMAASVQKLMHRISSTMSAVPPSDLDDVLNRSNQDDDDDDDYSGDSRSDDAGDPDGENTVIVMDDAALEALEPRMIETTSDPTYVPSCFPQAEMPQNLSASVRRLVIGLQDDSERRHETPAPRGLAIRRRGYSCPVPLPAAGAGPDHEGATAATTGSTALSPSDATPPSASLFAASLSDVAAAAPHKKKVKKSPFGRLAPRLLGSLPFRRGAKKKHTFHYTDEELESIEGARWKIVELAFRFGGKHRFYLVQAVNMFFPLLKYGRRGGPHATRLHCNHCGSVQWQHKRGSLSESVDLARVLQVLDGRQTAVFRKYPTTAALDACSFSIIFTDRTLDLETQSMSHRDWLMSALQTLISYAKTQRAAEERAIAERCLLPLDDVYSGHT